MYYFVTSNIVIYTVLHVCIRQHSVHAIFITSPGKQTHDLAITNSTLEQLSYSKAAFRALRCVSISYRTILLGEKSRVNVSAVAQGRHVTLQVEHEFSA